MTPGPALFARYGYPPNALGCCGPADCQGLLERADADCSDPVANGLLERVPARLLAAHVTDRFACRPGSGGELGVLAAGGTTTSPSSPCTRGWGLLRGGTVGEPVRVLQSCRTRWARVLSVHGGLVEVSSRPLR